MHNADRTLPNARQKQTCDKYQLPQHPPEDMVAIALDTLQRSPIYGTRIALPENGTISWFIHCGEHSSESGFYQALHTSHVADTLPEVVPYLFLPEGTKFIIDRAGYEDVWTDETE
ncbi:immunity protein Imm33 domain-containing protein [Pectobacterium brasiliense]|uniref:immunity protein Imm33 domain-containing protein n=1 Tax=Pectobacterium brasiliense TaxID=180957 RepID=UPI00406D3F3A